VVIACSTESSRENVLLYHHIQTLSQLEKPASSPDAAASQRIGDQVVAVLNGIEGVAIQEAVNQRLHPRTHTFFTGHIMSAPERQHICTAWLGNNLPRHAAVWSYNDWFKGAEGIQ
jgi:hypothetical protein